MPSLSLAEATPLLRVPCGCVVGEQVDGVVIIRPRNDRTWVAQRDGLVHTCRHGRRWRFTREGVEEVTAA